MATLQAIRYQRGQLEVLNQLKLPFETVFESVRNADDAWAQIREMKVRGAPAIAMVAALGLAVEVHTHLEGQPGKEAPWQTAADVASYIAKRWEHLKTSRPTAVNLFDAAARLTGAVEAASARAEASIDSVASTYLTAAEAMLAKDVADNRHIGDYGANAILLAAPAAKPVAVLTHCNTGSLATAGYGTALGIIRSLQSQGCLSHVYCTETRPYNQGARLTAYELVHERIPSTLITDSMAAALMAKGGISAVVVGADRVAANGDTANKIGTYQLAIVARHHGVPFFVAAPTTSIDLSLASGSAIPIEERAPLELHEVAGALVDVPGSIPVTPVHRATVRVSAPGIMVWNPGFDVTPAALITAIVTEHGVVQPSNADGSYDLNAFLAQPRGQGAKR